LAPVQKGEGLGVTVVGYGPPLALPRISWLLPIIPTTTNVLMNIRVNTSMGSNSKNPRLFPFLKVDGENILRTNSKVIEQKGTE
jgi:hypothetical protein